MPDVSRSHTYTFSLYGAPTIDVLIAELQQAKSIMTGEAKVRISTTDDQRDGYSMRAVVSR